MAERGYVQARRGIGDGLGLGGLLVATDRRMVASFNFGLIGSARQGRQGAG